MEEFGDGGFGVGVSGERSIVIVVAVVCEGEGGEVYELRLVDFESGFLFDFRGGGAGEGAAVEHACGQLGEGEGGGCCAGLDGEEHLFV